MSASFIRRKGCAGLPDYRQLNRHFAATAGLLLLGFLAVSGLLLPGCSSSRFMRTHRAKHFSDYRGEDAAVVVFDVKDRRDRRGVLEPHFYLMADGKWVYGGGLWSLYNLNEKPLCFPAGKHTLTWQLTYGSSIDEASGTRIFKENINLVPYGEYRFSVEVTPKIEIYRSFNGPSMTRLQGEPRQRLLEVVRQLGKLDLVHFDKQISPQVKELFASFQATSGIILRQALDGGADYEMQLGCVRAMGLMGKNAAFLSGRLIEMLAAGDPALTLSAAWALPRADERDLHDAKDALLKLYGNADPPLRYTILNGMGSFKPAIVIADCLPTVTAALGDSSPQIAGAARSTLQAFRASLSELLSDKYRAREAQNLILRIDAALKAD